MDMVSNDSYCLHIFHLSYEGNSTKLVFLLGLDVAYAGGSDDLKYFNFCLQKVHKFPSLGILRDVSPCSTVGVGGS